MSTIVFDTNTLLHVNGAQTGSGIWSGNGSANIVGFKYNNNGKLRVFKGALPTKSELNAVTNVATYRTTDLLITYLTYALWTYEGVNAKFNTPLPTVATGSGTASWFLMSNADSTSVTGIMLLAGDITLPGGGGEMTISDTTITSGQTYSLGTLLFTLPRLYTYP